MCTNIFKHCRRYLSALIFLIKLVAKKNRRFYNVKHCLSPRIFYYAEMTGQKDNFRTSPLIASQLKILFFHLMNF